MVRYNHFKKENMEGIDFSILNIGDKFRQYFHRGKRRTSILCKKMDKESYKEIRSGRLHSLYNPVGYIIYPTSSNKKESDKSD